MLFTHPIFRSPDGTNGGGSNGNGNDNPPPAGAGTPQGQPQGGGPNPQQSFQSLLERNSNDAQRVAWLLFQENYEHRQELRSAQGRVTELESQVQQLNGRLPGEGAVVLDTTQAQLWQQYQALGTPEQLGQTLRADLLRQAADAHGFKASALQTLASSLQLEMRQEERDGKTVPVAFVLQGEQATPLDQYAQTHWPDFLPSLAVQQGSNGRFVPQKPTGSQPQSNPVQATLQKRYVRPDKE